MTSLILRNGIVFDPLNNVRGERMDVLIKDGRIVDKLNEREAKIIDIHGKTVMPGGVDIHTHIAGGKVNAGRHLRPEEHERYVLEKTPVTRSGTGFSIPSTFMTGYLYAKMGYTTAFSPAMPPLFARHTHEELNDTPMVDKAAYTLCDGNWFIMRYLKNGDLEKCADYVAWLLKATKGFALKLVNPGGTEAWGWGGDVRGLDDVVPNFGITPRELIRGLIEVNEKLSLPHSVHLHMLNLGRPGNYLTAIETLKLIPCKKSSRQALHLTHLQFYCYGGESWKEMHSKSDEVAKAVNACSNVTIDTGSVTLDETTTMTADGPMEYYLQSLTNFKWVSGSIEAETSMGVTPFVYSPKMSTASVQWAIGLELPLLVDDPWKVMLTTDHPNGGPFFRYPRLIAWLMSRRYREETLSQVHSAVHKRALLPSIEREYSLNEIAIITRAAAAKALGLSKDVGHLGTGAAANVAVYDLDALALNSADYEAIEKSFCTAALTLKDGEIVSRNGEILRSVCGKTYWSDATSNREIEESLLKELDYFFRKFYSFTLANYPVQEKYVARPEAVVTEKQAAVVAV